ncbi:MAG: DUF4292 domain-containing protein [Cystobacterineae bacterium]|nr:DUF4292 domain-containing protein [Cystobacterineae bacterium]
MSLRETLPIALISCFVHFSCIHTAPTGQKPLVQMPPEQLIERIEREAAEIRSLKGQARLKIDAPQQKGVVEVLIAVQLPDSIHLELLDGLGRPLRIFVSHSGRFSLWDLEKSEFFRGVATQENLERFLPLYFSPRELVQVLLGMAPRFMGGQVQVEEDTQNRGGGGKRRYLWLRAENFSQLWSVDVEDFRVIESELKGARDYHLTFASFVRLNSRKVFPEKRTLKVPSSELFLELSYTDYSTNKELEEKLFILAPPQGIRVVDVEEGISLDGGGG